MRGAVAPELLPTARRMTDASHRERPLLWNEMTWPEIAALRDGGMDMVILPVGSTEQHGPHLALDTDTVTATTVAHAAWSTEAGGTVSTFSSVIAEILPPRCERESTGVHVGEGRCVVR